MALHLCRHPRFVLSLSAPSAAPQPVRQWLRIFALRAAFIGVLPLILLADSGWHRWPAMMELLEVLGVSMIVAAILGRFWSILYIGSSKNRTVMDQGPYSICRHPLYLSSTIGVVGFGLMLGSVMLAVVLGALFFTILSMTASREEAYLRAAFGPAYDAYAARVPRILPRLSGFTTAPSVDVSVHALRKNLADALVFLALFPLAELAELLHTLFHLPTITVW